MGGRSLPTETTTGRTPRLGMLAQKPNCVLPAGATLVLQGLHRTWGPIGDFTRALVRDLGHPAQVNAYITPASSRGFDPHYDTHDVWAVQVEGEKAWNIWEGRAEYPIAAISGGEEGAARAFINFVLSDEGQAILKKHGFE